MGIEMNNELTFEKIMELSGHGQGSIPHTECKKYLRHTHPMLSLDHVTDHDFTAGWIHAVRGISCSDPVFAGHFPDAGVYPGTNLNQDVNQVGILLFIGMTSPLKKEGANEEITAVNATSSEYGHPVPPGCLIDMAIWATKLEGKKKILLRFESRVRDFPYYSQANKYGLKFEAAIKGSCTLVRARRSFYDGIWL
jgi:3-hydroxymyristoyl/3-hydroxydecanoyl-(acyl carrier protein) dehydratase